MNTQVTTDKFLLLNTQKTDGYPFYGRGLGSATIDITGPFNQLDMMVHAETGPTSHVSIPISSTISVDDKEAFFIDFVTDSAFEEVVEGQQSAVEDRKSTRLNTSHVVISYVVFCLKKNKNSTRN